MPTDNPTNTAPQTPSPKAPKKPKPEPTIDIAPATVEIRKRDLEWKEFSDQVLAARTQPKPEVVPPKPTERQMTQTQREMEAGRKRSEAAEEQYKKIRAAVRDGSEGSTTPVFRPRDHVPNMDSKDPLIRTLK